MCGFLALAGGKSPQNFMSDFFAGLSRLQHRGQGSAGGAFSNGSRVTIHKDMGLVPSVFTQEVLSKIGSISPVMAIGHTRYPTSGNSSTLNAQPHWLHDRRGLYAYCGNGDVPDLESLKMEWAARTGMVFESTNDSELILKMIDYFIDIEKPNWQIEFIHGIRRMMETIRATYAGGLLTGTRLYVYRDPYENRPLFYGRCEDGIFVASSETSVLDCLDAKLLGEVEGGEILIVKPDGTFEHTQGVPKRKRQFCIFEYIYFSRPDSKTQKGFLCSMFRRILGVLLARHEKQIGLNHQIDCVQSVPDSGNFFAEAYAWAMKIAFRIGTVRDAYVGRTFIDSDESEMDSRKTKAGKKYTVLKDIPQGIRSADGEEFIPPMVNVVIGDDSIVRFLTTEVMMAKASRAGYKDVHFRISSPPIVSPCYFGINMKTLEELIAAKMSVEEMIDQLGAASLMYLPMEQLKAAIVAIGEDPDECCMKCLGVPCQILDSFTV